jgi:hypothetical protein
MKDVCALTIHESIILRMTIITKHMHYEQSVVLFKLAACVANSSNTDRHKDHKGSTKTDVDVDKIAYHGEKGTGLWGKTDMNTHKAVDDRMTRK